MKKNLSFTRPLRLTAMAAALAAASCAAHADEFDTLRLKWQERLTGASFLDSAAPADAARLAQQGSSAMESWQGMDKTPGRSALWSDIADWKKSSTLTNNYRRVRALANAFATPGNALYGDKALAADIVGALTWLRTQHYNAKITYYDNWWDWQIGTPQALLDVLTLMYGQLNEAQLAAEFVTIDHFIPNANRRPMKDGRPRHIVETGANRLDMALVVIMRGILGRNAAKIASGRDDISQTFELVKAGDGYYADDSFVQHTYVPYTGAYGVVAMADFAQLFYLLGGSSWAITDPRAANVYRWAQRSYAPLVYDGAMMDMVRGRGISRAASEDHRTGRNLAASLALLAEGLPPDQAGWIRATIKGWMQRDSINVPDYCGPAMAVYDCALLRRIQANAAIAARPEGEGVKLYASMDRAVMRGPGFAFGMAMFSPRISAFEVGNVENGRGWWTGMGMGTLYNADQAQYSDGYWATVDTMRLPGTTTDRSVIAKPVEWKNYSNPRTMVGGAVLDERYAVLAMDFATRETTSSSLEGKKTWFLFGDRIVAAGAGISAADGAAVETIVENRKLNGAEVLTVDGKAKTLSLQWKEAMPAVRWAHLAAKADIGYVFPDAPALDGLAEARSGSWRDINRDGPTAQLTRNYLSLALPHGLNPQGAGYTYVLLPGRSAQQTAAYAAQPSVRVLERSNQAIAIADTALGLTGAVFWEDAAHSVGFIGSDKKAAVLVREEGKTLRVAVADPTQVNGGKIRIELGRRAVRTLKTDEGVKVLRLEPTIQLEVDVKDAAGKTFTAQFEM